jgi:DNA modification methylase
MINASTNPSFTDGEKAESSRVRGKNEGDVWFKPFRNELHPTQKPVEVVKRANCNSSKRDDLVLDPFAGSGTTLLARERTGRRRDR